MSLAQQAHTFQDFRDVWKPYRPYATDNYTRGIQRMAREDALHLRHVEANSPHATNLIVVDIDHPDAVLRALWERDGWRPNYVIENSSNGHAHAVWALQTGVARTEYARRKPLAYCAAVQEGLRRSVDGDPGYSGLMMKTPMHEDWNTLTITHDLYDLDELATHLEDVGFLPPQDWRKRAKRDVAGLGRNCTLFELLRHEAYPLINKYWGDANGYTKHVENLALQINADTFSNPLPSSEVLASAHSVARWVTTKSSMWRDGKAASDKRFSDRQTWRSARATAKRVEKRQDRVRAAYEVYRASGGSMTNKEIAEAVGMSVDWVKKHRAAIKGTATHC